MNRHGLAPDAGMLFPFDPPRPASFWMRNTLIPLDMIWMDASGKVLFIRDIGEWNSITIPASLDHLLGMGIGPLICAVALMWMRELQPDFSYWMELFPAILVFSVGLSLIVAPLTSTVLADAGESDAGIASGVNNAIARVAGLLGIAVVGAAIAGPGNELDLSGYRMAMGITAVLIASGGVIGLVGIRNPSRARVGEPRPAAE